MKRVSLLSDMHLRNIRTKLLLMSRNHEATKHLEVGLRQLVDRQQAVNVTVMHTLTFQ